MADSITGAADISCRFSATERHDAEIALASDS